MSDKLLMRKEVPENLKWDLSLIYKTEAEFIDDTKKIKELANDIEGKYKGNLNTPKMIVDCLSDFEEVLKISTLISHYASLAVEVDYYDVEAQTKNGKVDDILSTVFSQLSFIDSEIAEQNEETLSQAVELAKGCKLHIKDILSYKPHMLEPETEKVLKAISNITNTPYSLYCTMKLADMKFDNFEVNGKSYPLGYSLFEDNYEFEVDTDVRRGAFNAFSKKIKEYENATAAAYNSYVQHEKTMAKLRKFDNIFQPDLFNDKVNEELYNRQIDLIMDKLAPHMRKYAKLIKKVHNLDKITFADLHLRVDPNYTPSITIEDSKKYIINGLSILGDDYVKMINQAYDERWVDFAQNQGKCTGGFCASPYNRNSFILMSWNNKMSDVFTLAHELGHAGHFKLCNAEQSIYDTDVPRYFVEAPSTMNELLMSHYLLDTSDDKRFRRWVLSNMVGDTYYHNCVTHLLEAYYQREVYKIVENGGSVQAETLSKIFKDTLEKFWSGEVEINPGAELTWMRQPHYYMGLYSYSYSAGLTIATQMCKRIKKEGAPAVEDWKKVLKAGSTLPPIELAALGGIDITTDAALIDTIETIGSYIDEIIALTDEI